MAVPSFTSKARRYADGGPMPMQGAPAPGGPPADPAAGGGQDPGAQLQAAATQYAQTKDPQLAVQIADMVVEVMGLGGGGASAPAPGGDPAMAGGGGAPMGGAPMGGAPMSGPGPQMNKKGGKMPSFGKKAMPGGKPAFAAPGAGGAKSNPFGNKDAAPFQKGGKPMSADQKMKAKNDAKKAASFGKK